jgi:tRNA/tmRNA/rRNA uracil-C5-methylase (TrmA/RlmC/RlmD family)
MCGVGESRTTTRGDFSSVVVVRSRAPRGRQPRGRSRVGERYQAVVGDIAHGGHCIVRLVDADGPDVGRVVFTRHALPGERVIVEITEGTHGDPFWRGDAVEILESSPDRVAAPCVVAGPGLCGGCDFQHVSLTRQRALKAEVVREQLSRLAGLAPPVVVEAVPGDQDGLRWRTRMRFAETPDGRPGLRSHRSSRVVPIGDCLIAKRSPLVEATPAGPLVERVETAHGSYEFRHAADGFWQVHPGAPAVLVETVLAMLAPKPGERALDLYAGVGLFARFLADAVGTRGRVLLVEADLDACRHARENLNGSLSKTKVACGKTAQVLKSEYDEPFDLVVLDPPREGAKRVVVDQIADRAPRAVAYVACDPAALARDVAIFVQRGYRLVELRAFDLFPMTSHVECVAHLVKSDSGLR